VGVITSSSIRLTISVYIWGSEEGNEPNEDPSERTRWLGKIMAIRAAAKDKVFMYVLRVPFPLPFFLSPSLFIPSLPILMPMNSDKIAGKMAYKEDGSGDLALFEGQR
jgi:hypothetical protein